jgi:hypothetical protein
MLQTRALPLTIDIYAIVCTNTTALGPAKIVPSLSYPKSNFSMVTLCMGFSDNSGQEARQAVLTMSVVLDILGLHRKNVSVWGGEGL